MAELFRIVTDADREEAIRLAGSILRGGGLVAFPTETVYGVGVHMEDKVAVRRLYRLKGRAPDKPLTLHIGELAALDRYGIQATPEEYRLIKYLWPGPLTLILRNKKGEQMGVRWPRHELACQIIRASGVPIGCPSANFSGATPPTTADEVAKGLRDEIDLIVDGGETELRTSSTVVSAERGVLKILREGAISKEALLSLWENQNVS